MRMRSSLRRDHMGIVFQSFHLIPTMTALENVAIPLELAGIEVALNVKLKKHWKAFILGIVLNIIHRNYQAGSSSVLPLRGRL